MNGNGTQVSPFEVTTAVEFNSIRNNLTAHYILMNDIDLASYSNFVPIGTSSIPFKGTVDGNGFKVRGLNINRNVANTGLFGYVDGATVKKLGIVEANVNSQSSNYSGIVTGYMTGTTLIDQCYATGVLNGQYGQGGIAGRSSGGTISNCWTNVSVTSLGRAGGILGHNLVIDFIIRDSYTYSPVESPLYANAMAGSGVNNTHISNSYFNSDVYPTDTIATPLTTAQFADSSNFTGWDSTIWGFADYPYLKAFGVPEAPPVPAKIQTETVTSHSGIVLSSLSHSKRKLESVVITTQPIAQSVSRKATAIAESMIDNIVSNVEVLENANVETHIVSSHVSGIGSTAKRMVKAIRSVEVNMQPFSIITEVIVPVDVEIPVYATVHIIENQSNVNSITNKTDTTIQENATETSVI